MTECTEVSYIVPSYFFCFCSAVGDQARRGVVAVFFTAVFFLQLYEYAVFPSFRKLYSIFYLASPTSQRITLINVERRIMEER